jgi:hypothetical protein
VQGGPLTVPRSGIRSAYARPVDGPLAGTKVPGQPPAYVHGLRVTLIAGTTGETGKPATESPPEGSETTSWRSDVSYQGMAAVIRSGDGLLVRVRVGVLRGRWHGARQGVGRRGRR